MNNVQCCACKPHPQLIIHTVNPSPNWCSLVIMTISMREWESKRENYAYIYKGMDRLQSITNNTTQTIIRLHTLPS